MRAFVRGLTLALTPFLLFAFFAFSALFALAPYTERIALAAPPDIARALGLSAQKDGAEKDTKTDGSDDKETVAPDSPRASMAEFFALTRAERYVEASKFLQLPRGTFESGEAKLAEELDTVLRRHLNLDIDALSAEGAGHTADGLPAGVDELGKIPSKARGVAPEAVRIVRTFDVEGKGRWVFARSTVERAPRWYAELPERWLRERLPRALLKTGPRGISYWQWIALPLLFAAAWAIGHVLGNVTRGFARLLLRSHPTLSKSFVVSAFSKPLVYAWAFILSGLLLEYLAFERGPYERIQLFLKAGLIGTFFWGLVRVVDVVVQSAQTAPWASLNPATAGLLPLLGKIVKLALVVVALFESLSIFGVQVTSIVAGLGIGGLAVALAAQKTIENLFGAVTLALDEPFRIGDYITVDGVSGNVESLGLRSTRIRTLDRTLITMPNSKLADLRIENFAHRDRYRIRERLALDLETPGERLDAVVTSLRAILGKHPALGPDAPLVTFRGVVEGTLVIEVLGWFLAPNLSEFEALRHAFLRQAIDCVEAEGVHFAAIATRAHDRAK